MIDAFVVSCWGPLTRKKIIEPREIDLKPVKRSLSEKQSGSDEIASSSMDNQRGSCSREFEEPLKVLICSSLSALTSSYACRDDGRHLTLNIKLLSQKNKPT